ncbi:anthranilate phosphoribosyltransferase [Bacillus daqingensis]|uniref:Anthranilate phosphoribosyltransferase n=1 Tax=Bacillus daqingensis TaxID=872396 RepID=A0ABV9NV38_9BACI
MQELLKKTARGKRRAQDLSFDESVLAAERIVSGESTPAQTAALFTSQRLKEESADETAGFASVLKRHTIEVPVSEDVRSRMIDSAGPYNGRRQFAATIPVSIILSAAGIPVYLHSAPTLPPKYNPSLENLLQELGIETFLPPEALGKGLDTLNIGFGRTEDLCPPLAKLRPLREELGFRTYLNTIEKLLSPPQAASTLTGIFHRTVVKTNSGLMRNLAFQHSYMVQGVEGSEDIPVHRKSFLFHVTEERTTSFDVNPADYGLGSDRVRKLEDLTPKCQAALIQRVLLGKKASPEDQNAWNIVMLNAGVRLFLFGHTASISEGISLAEETAASGKAWHHYLQWREFTHETHSVYRTRQQRPGQYQRV